jgi:hypothetical protein
MLEECMGVQDLVRHDRYDSWEAVITGGKGEDTMGKYSNLPMLKKHFEVMKGKGVVTKEKG